MGECFFWYRPTRVVPDQRPLNGCVCVFVTPAHRVGGTEWGGGNVSCTVCLSVCLFVNSITEKLMVVFCKILEVDIFWDSEKSWLNFAA